MENQESKTLSTRLAIASTFICNPIEGALEFWGKKFGLQTELSFSPYDQVFQELLNQQSLLNQSKNDARLVIVKFDDWVRNLSNMTESSAHTHIISNIHSLCKYAEISATFAKSPLFLTIVRNSTGSIIKPEKQTEFEQLVRDKIAEHSNIIVTTSTEINKKYPVDDYYDEHRD